MFADLQCQWSAVLVVCVRHPQAPLQFADLRSALLPHPLHMRSTSGWSGDCLWFCRTERAARLHQEHRPYQSDCPPTRSSACHCQRFCSVSERLERLVFCFDSRHPHNTQTTPAERHHTSVLIHECSESRVSGTTPALSGPNKTTPSPGMGPHEPSWILVSSPAAVSYSRSHRG